MKKITAFTGILFIAFFFSFFSSFIQSAGAAEIKKNESPEAKVLRLRDRQVISFGQMIREIGGADIIILGESHASEADHRAELAVIEALHASVAPLALGLEMFRAGSQKDLDAWVQGDIPQKDFQLVYYDNWELPWSLYRDIFLFARQVGMPVFGLNVDSEISNKVFEHGFDSLSPAEKKDLPSGITCTVDEEYMRYIKEMYQFHQGMGGKSFYDFCQAQMLWDSVMAANITARLRKTPGVKMVVLAGMGHAWKKGIPAQIKKISNYRYVVVLPGMQNSEADQDITSDEADYLLLGPD